MVASDAHRWNIETSPPPPLDIGKRGRCEGLPIAMTMIAAHVVAVPPNDDDAGLLHDDQRRAMIVRAVVVTVRVSVSIVGTADDDLTRDVWASKAERDPDAGLGHRNTCCKPE